MKDLRKFIKTTIRDFLNEHLTYDELDLDWFTRNYIVGRWFGSQSDATKYLESIIDKSNDKDINDFVIIKDALTKKSRGFGFITFSSLIEVDKVMKSRPHIIEGRKLDLKRISPKNVIKSFLINF